MQFSDLEIESMIQTAEREVQFQKFIDEAAEACKISFASFTYDIMDHYSVARLNHALNHAIRESLPGGVCPVRRRAVNGNEKFVDVYTGFNDYTNDYSLRVCRVPGGPRYVYDILRKAGIGLS